MAAILEALGPFALLLIAGLAFILYEVVRVILIDPVTGSIRTVPYIGPTLADWLSGFWDSFEVNLRAVVDIQVRNLSDLITFVSGSIQLVFNAATTTAEWLGIQVGNALTLAQSVAGDVATQLSHLGALVNQTVTGILALTKTVEDFIATEAGKIADAINKAITQTEANIHVWADAEIHSITDPLAKALQQFHDGLQHKIELETGRASTMEGQLAGDITTAKRDVEAELKVVRAALRTKIGNVEGTLEQELGTLTDIIGTVAAGTTVVGLITTVATDLTRMERECVDPTCGYLSPQLPILNGIADLATAAAFAAFMVAAVQNPKGAASAVSEGANALEGIFGPVFSSMSGIQL